jgi:hypothetical protein
MPHQNYLLLMSLKIPCIEKPFILKNCLDGKKIIENLFALKNPLSLKNYFH